MTKRKSERLARVKKEEEEVSPLCFVECVLADNETKKCKQAAEKDPFEAMLEVMPFVRMLEMMTLKGKSREPQQKVKVREPRTFYHSRTIVPVAEGSDDSENESAIKRVLSIDDYEGSFQPIMSLWTDFMITQK
jgi:hypothetical protein